METASTRTPEARARHRAQYLIGLLWHVATFVIINALLWTLDAVVGAAGIQWAFWVTLSWGIGVAFHTVAWFVDGSDFEERQVRRYLAEHDAERDEPRTPEVWR